MLSQPEPSIASLGAGNSWCAARDAVPILVAPAMICAYLTDRATEGASVGANDAPRSQAWSLHTDDIRQTLDARVDRRPPWAPAGAAIIRTIRRVKTDQYAEGQVVAVVLSGTCGRADHPALPACRTRHRGGRSSASRWTGSPPRLGTSACPRSSSATSVPPRPRSTPSHDLGP